MTDNRECKRARRYCNELRKYLDEVNKNIRMSDRWTNEFSCMINYLELINTTTSMLDVIDYYNKKRGKNE